MLFVVVTTLGLGFVRASEEDPPDARLAVIDQMKQAAHVAPPKSPTQAEQVRWMEEHAAAQKSLVLGIEAFLAANPTDAERSQLRSMQMDACFVFETMSGESLDMLGEIATACLVEAGGDEALEEAAVCDAEYWLVFREMQRLESHALRGQINAADQLAAMERFANSHTDSLVSVPLMAKLIEGWTGLEDYVRADEWLAVLKAHHPNHVTTRAVDGRRRLQRAIGTVWRPELKDVHGDSIDWKQLEGRVTLVVFWSSTNSISMQAVEFVRRLDQSFAEDYLHVVAVSLDSDPSLAVDAATAQSSDWSVVCDGLGWSGALPQTYGIRSLPTLFLLDGQGLLRRVWFAGDESSHQPEIEAIVRKLVGEWHAAVP